MPVYVARLSQWIEKRFNAKGGNVITDIDTTAHVVYPWQMGREDRYLQGWGTYAGTTTIAAAAANQSGFRFRNPTGSNVIAVFEKLTLSITANDVISGSHGPTTSDLITGGTNTLALDRRGNLNATCLFSTQNTTVTVPSLTAPVGGLWLGAILANTTYDVVRSIGEEIPILPGFGIQFVTTNVNEQLLLSWIVREQRLEPSELT